MAQIDLPSEASQNPEAVRQPILNIEKIKKLLDLELEERGDELVEAQITDVQQQSQLAQQIAERLSDPSERKNFPYLPEDNADILKVIEGEIVMLRQELKVKEEVLLHKAEKFKAIENDPAKKSLMGKALDVMKKGLKFTWKHKWKILIALALVAGGVAGWYYKDAIMGLLGLGGGSGVGIGAGEGVGIGGAAAESAGEAAAEGVAAAGEAGAEGAGAVAEIADGVTDVGSLKWPLETGEWLAEAGKAAGSDIEAGKALRIALKGGEVVEVGGQEYSIETFKKLFESWGKSNGVGLVKIQRYGSALPSLENDVGGFLKSMDVQSWFLDGLLD